MRDLDQFAAALRRLAEGSADRKASCPLGNGLRVTIEHQDTETDESIYCLSVARYHTAPHPDDLAPLAESFRSPAGAEWNWRVITQNGGRLHVAWCRWHERAEQSVAQGV